ncbi:GD25680 [Drosophila simulans]|uniref:GD25680 n=1 Tax=Drosophila simulans TaxID=7240 RepID=B4NV36_DROSI|nr:GD25680 [Drosophila simulans]
MAAMLLVTPMSRPAAVSCPINPGSPYGRIPPLGISSPKDRYWDLLDQALAADPVAATVGPPVWRPLQQQMDPSGAEESQIPHSGIVFLLSAVASRGGDGVVALDHQLAVVKEVLASTTVDARRFEISPSIAARHYKYPRQKDRSTESLRASGVITGTLSGISFKVLMEEARLGLGENSSKILN